MSDRKLILLFTGTRVELVEALDEENESVIWSSDDDDEFRDQFTDEELDPDEDSEAIIEWLEENNCISKDEADTLEICSEPEDSDDEGLTELHLRDR